MGNGKKPETVGEHVIALYGHITGVKRDVEELRAEVKESTEKSDNMHNKFEQKFETITKWIVYGLGTTITILIGISTHLFLK